jgi:hypothetical protein
MPAVCEQEIEKALAQFDAPAGRSAARRTY